MEYQLFKTQIFMENLLFFKYSKMVKKQGHPLDFILKLTSLEILDSVDQLKAA